MNTRKEKTYELKYRRLRDQGKYQKKQFTTLNGASCWLREQFLSIEFVYLKKLKDGDTK